MRPSLPPATTLYVGYRIERLTLAKVLRKIPTPKKTPPVRPTGGG